MKFRKFTILNIKASGSAESEEVEVIFNLDHIISIKPIRIFINEDKNNEKSVGFEEVSNVVFGKYAEVVTEVEKDTNNYTIDNMVKNGKKVNLIINGQLQTATIKSKIPLDQEIDIFIELDEKQLKSKYNIDKKNIIKDFFNYIIRSHPKYICKEFMSFIENLMHSEIQDNNVHLNYSLSRLPSFISTP